MVRYRALVVAAAAAARDILIFSLLALATAIFAPQEQTDRQTDIKIQLLLLANDSDDDGSSIAAMHAIGRPLMDDNGRQLTA